ncbi:sigma 54-interacting transcriptional regulator [Flavobacterium sp. MAH-1]|uniref:Sigma 54-interacting transcriptional regulator n=1 Tax=Flavobacterium agri TaxID=2743471 RepID=A0A7Y9C5Q0_9FLAO|nr:sigma 54-interacting response regulator [Flavobacterium agri]NUY81497.1 sigma 54-interacting transcriptional regulator [Flavobacterium agri]NYA71521.1 sigma 54-interacting transcriptional regulator [Flavobacterium agri]
MNKETKILIVEDQFVEANHLQLMLKRAGYQVIGIARTVPDAKKIIAQQRPGLVLLDIFLSGKETGIDLARFLKDENIAFIYLSANSNEKVLNEAKATHPYGFLVKPFRDRDLLVAMEIAQYHQQNGIEAMMRMESTFQKKVRELIPDALTWDDRIFALSKAMQPLLPFDVVVAVYRTGSQDTDKTVGFMRTGFSEYQKLGMPEFQNITTLKEHEVKKLQYDIPIDQKITLYANDDFAKLCRTVSMKQLMATSFGARSNITFPVDLSVDGASFFLSFFSRKPNGFDDSHVEMCTRIKPTVASVVSEFIAAEKHGKSKEKNQQQSKPESGDFEGIIGKSPVLLSVFDNILQVAAAETTVLILGESGTGKERIASSIHTISPRKSGPFIKVNCSALPANLIETELFGHEKGSFTGASERRIGKFEQAHKGTLFLDEIGEMPIEIQAKLLRAIQEKEIERIGGTTTIKVDVRILAATNRNLEKEVAEGRFRLDLYYRLNVFPIEIPSLRERREDVPRLAKHFLRHFAAKNNKPVERLSEQALKSLLNYNWPGNIRELENLMERSVLLSRTDTIEEIPLPQKKEIDETSSGWYLKTIEENEREHIEAVLKRVNGRIRGVGGAAEILGVPPTTLASKIQKLGIKRINGEIDE